MHVVSSASIKKIGYNKLESFRNFFKEEIQFQGEWRVALSENIFSTKIENIFDLQLTVYNLKDYEDSQKIYSGDNVISQPYSGQKPAFTPETFDTRAQFLAVVKRIAGLPHFSFRELELR